MRKAAGIGTGTSVRSAVLVWLAVLAAACSGTSAGQAASSPHPSESSGLESASPILLAPMFSIDVPDPADMELAFGSIWTGNHHQNSVTRIDPKTGEVEATIRNVGYQVLALVEADGALWAGSARDGMVRIDPDTNTVVAEVKGQVGDLALGFGSLWATTFDHTVRRIDPSTGDVIATIEIGSGETDMRSWVAIDDAHQAVWVGVGDEGIVDRIDPRTDEIVATLGQVGDDPRVLISGGSVWIIGAEDQELRRVDPSTNRAAPDSIIDLSSSDFCAPRSTVGERIWFACSDGMLYQFEPSSGDVLAAFDLSEGHGYGAAGGIEFDGSIVWTASTLGQVVRAFELPYSPASDPG